jgi:hypothetical protein
MTVMPDLLWRTRNNASQPLAQTPANPLTLCKLLWKLTKMAGTQESAREETRALKMLNPTKPLTAKKLHATAIFLQATAMFLQATAIFLLASPTPTVVNLCRIFRRKIANQYNLGRDLVWSKSAFAPKQTFFRLGTYFRVAPM